MIDEKHQDLDEEQIETEQRTVKGSDFQRPIRESLQIVVRRRNLDPRLLKKLPDSVLNRMRELV